MVRNTQIECNILKCLTFITGGCKHSVAALSFLLLDSENPSPTSSSCYWRPPPLNAVRTKGITMPLAEIKSGGIKRTFDHSSPNTSIFERWKQRAVEENLDCQILPYLKPQTSVDTICMDLLIVKFKEEYQRNRSLSNFIRFMKNYLTDDVCKEVEVSTRSQSSSKFWHALRFGQITASNLYEISKCKTADGSLVQRLLGGKTFQQTPAMRRGNELEPQIMDVLKKKFPDIQKVGLHLSPEYPLYGASPDAQSSDFVFEMKSPISNETKLSYVKNGEVQQKVKAQISLQMLLTKKKIGYLVVADPEFESNKKIELFQVNFDRKFCCSLMASANKFYNENVFPKMIERI